jgi:hypothetical protein
MVQNLLVENVRRNDRCDLFEVVLETSLRGPSVLGDCAVKLVLVIMEAFCCIKHKGASQSVDGGLFRQKVKRWPGGVQRVEEGSALHTGKEKECLDLSWWTHLSLTRRSVSPQQRGLAGVLSTAWEFVW